MKARRELAAERDRADRLAQALRYFHSLHDCPAPAICPVSDLLIEHEAARSGAR